VHNICIENQVRGTCVDKGKVDERHLMIIKIFADIGLHVKKYNIPLQLH